jgi:hypothetical protein
VTGPLDAMSLLTPPLAVVHLGLIAAWLGSMLYSLLIVQPRVARFLAGDDDQLEALLTVLGAGHRRPVLALVAGIIVSGGLLAVATEPTRTQIVLYLAEVVLVVTAASLFARVSWRLWPRRVFALPVERPTHRAALRLHALAMTVLVSGSFAVAVVAISLPA